MNALVAIRWAQKVERGELGASSRSVLVALSTYVGRSGAVVWPSIRTIALDTGLAKSTVERALDDLEQRGLMVRSKVGRSNRYTLAIVVDSTDPLPNSTDPEAVGTGNVPTTRTEVTDEVREKGTDAVSSSTQRERGRRSKLRAGSAAEHGPTSCELERW